MARKTHNKTNTNTVVELRNYKMVCQNVMRPIGNILEYFTMPTSGRAKNSTKQKFKKTSN